MHRRHGGMIGSGVAVNFGNEFYNPPTPLNIPVGGFRHGQRLRLVVVPTGNFTVNLKSPHDIFLHFDSRFDEQSVVRNSTHHGGWQHEERDIPLFPFVPNRVYTLEFTSDNGHVHVTLNGRPFIVFQERYPGHDITEIEVKGNIHLHSAHVSHV